MKLIALVVSTLIACGGSSKQSNNATGGGGGQGGQAGESGAMVDPTVPSWTPASCKQYNGAVVQAIACTPIEQSKRDEIQATYDADSASWKAEQNVTDARIAEVSQSCIERTKSVRAAIGNLCVAGKR